MSDIRISSNAQSTALEQPAIQQQVQPQVGHTDSFAASTWTKAEQPKAAGPAQKALGSAVIGAARSTMRSIIDGGTRISSSLGKGVGNVANRVRGLTMTMPTFPSFTKGKVPSTSGGRLSFLSKGSSTPSPLASSIMPNQQIHKQMLPEELVKAGVMKAYDDKGKTVFLDSNKLADKVFDKLGKGMERPNAKDKEFAMEMVKYAASKECGTNTPTLAQLNTAIEGLKMPEPTNVGWGAPENSPEVLLLNERLGTSQKNSVNVPGAGDVSGQAHRDFEGALNYKGVDMDGIGKSVDKAVKDSGGADSARLMADARAKAVYADLQKKMEGAPGFADDQKAHAAHVAITAMSQAFEDKGWGLAREWGKENGFLEARELGISVPRSIETSVEGGTLIVKVTQGFCFNPYNEARDGPAEDGNGSKVVGRMNITREVHINIGDGQSKAMGESYSFGTPAKDEY